MSPGSALLGIAGYHEVFDPLPEDSTSNSPSGTGSVGFRSDCSGVACVSSMFAHDPNGPSGTVDLGEIGASDIPQLDFVRVFWSGDGSLVIIIKKDFLHHMVKKNGVEEETDYVGIVVDGYDFKRHKSGCLENYDLPFGTANIERNSPQCTQPKMPSFPSATGLENAYLSPDFSEKAITDTTVIVTAALVATKRMVAPNVR